MAESPVRTVHVPVVLTPVLKAAGTEKIDVIPDFISFEIAKISDQGLADVLGQVKDYRKDVEKWEKLAVDVVKGRMQNQAIKQIFGEKYSLDLRSAPRSTLDVQKVIAKFGAAAIADCYTETEVYTLTAKKL